MAKAVKKAAAKKAVKKQEAKKSSKTPAKKSPKAPLKKKAAKKKKEDLMCFLTSACVDFYGLSDTGYELTTLRQYRDSYLMTVKGGPELVHTYYRVSPLIVTQLQRDEHKEKKFAYIYSQVQAACLAIEKKQFEKAKNVYRAMVNRLRNIYFV